MGVSHPGRACAPPCARIRARVRLRARLERVCACVLPLRACVCVPVGVPVGGVVRCWCGVGGLGVWWRRRWVLAGWCGVVGAAALTSFSFCGGGGSYLFFSRRCVVHPSFRFSLGGVRFVFVSVFVSVSVLVFSLSLFPPLSRLSYLLV